MARSRWEVEHDIPATLPHQRQRFCVHNSQVDLSNIINPKIAYCVQYLCRYHYQRYKEHAGIALTRYDHLSLYTSWYGVKVFSLHWNKKKKKKKKKKPKNILEIYNINKTNRKVDIRTPSRWSFPQFWRFRTYPNFRVAAVSQKFAHRSAATAGARPIMSNANIEAN